RLWVGGGPSSKTWPRWASHRLQSISIRLMRNRLSRSVLMFMSETGSQKLGQPVPDSNFVFEEKRWLPQQTQTYRPSSLQSQYFPVKAGSVPAFRATENCSDVSWRRHSSSDLMTLSTSSTSPATALKTFTVPTVST